MSLTTRHKPTVHDRKRQAGHHHHSKSYLKSYWPYLPMLLIVSLGLLVNSTWSSKSVLGSSSDFSTASLLNDTNAQRAKLGESALTVNAQLSAAAQAKADDMVRNNYWAHTSPAGRTPWSFITAAGYQYQSAGENLAYGFANANQSVAGWMNSTEHRDNILNAAFRNVGFGVASSSDFVGQGPATVVVAEYAQPAITTAAASPPGVAAAPPTAAASTPPSNVLGTSADTTTSQPVSRIQLLTGPTEWGLLIAVVITGAAAILFTLRHGYRLHRALARGEAFVTHHPYLDITVVFILTAGCVLTRTGGIIR
ncbi:MAG TPA: CAP domain-containing protein [Candidatus Saccharimonadales bacterium]|nr:CAP domain-containing protein [Candidatus Saccharimonadales bacterium]